MGGGGGVGSLGASYPKTCIPIERLALEGPRSGWKELMKKREGKGGRGNSEHRKQRMKRLEMGQYFYKKKYTLVQGHWEVAFELVTAKLDHGQLTGLQHEPEWHELNHTQAWP